MAPILIKQCAHDKCYEQFEAFDRHSRCYRHRSCFSRKTLCWQPCARCEAIASEHREILWPKFRSVIQAWRDANPDIEQPVPDEHTPLVSGQFWLNIYNRLYQCHKVRTYIL